MASMYSAYDIHHILCNIDGNKIPANPASNSVMMTETSISPTTPVLAKWRYNGDMMREHTNAACSLPIISVNGFRSVSIKWFIPCAYLIVIGWSRIRFCTVVKIHVPHVSHVRIMMGIMVNIWPKIWTLFALFAQTTHYPVGRSAGIDCEYDRYNTNNHFYPEIIW